MSNNGSTPIDWPSADRAATSHPSSRVTLLRGLSGLLFASEGGLFQIGCLPVQLRSVAQKTRAVFLPR
jgi:hypothetical protein